MKRTRDVVIALGVSRAKTPLQKCVLILTLAELEAAEAESERRRRLWWRQKLAACAPVLSGGDGSDRVQIFYGRRSNNARQRVNPFAPKVYYEHFRFAREDIPRLVRALRMPHFVRTRSGCVLDGEEALLIFLKRMSYPNRIVELLDFFGRSVGYLSEMVEAVRSHLHQIAQRLVLHFDHLRIIPWIPIFAAAFEAKGCPLPQMWALLDGTFRDFCRPSKDGYAGLAQRVQYNGSKKKHGNNHQGLETPDGIIVEMHGPYEGITHDQRMLRESGLLDRVIQFCTLQIRGVPTLFYMFGDRGYVHGHEALQVPYKGAGLAAYQLQFNYWMSKFRQPVEWSFGKVCRYFPFVDFEKNQKLYLQPVASYWQIATLLTNCHSCLYGNQTSRYFRVPTPELEDYLRNGFP